MTSCQESTTKHKDRPLVTFALFAYNQEKYIRKAVEGALDQQYEPLEIILSDDCSNDRTYQIMKEVVASYNGHHTVKLRRNTTNVGLASHFSNVIKQSKGEIIIVAAGDDISLPNRCKESVNIFIENEQCNFVDVSAVEINDVGDEIKPNKKFESGLIDLKKFIKYQPNGLSGAARAYRKSAICFFPSLSPQCPTEDTTSVLRCLLSGTGILVNKKLFLRRHHDRNLSGILSMRSMKLDKILIQYLSDINYAKEYGMIDESTKIEVDGWATQNIFKRKMMQDIANGEMTLHKIIKIICSSKSVNTKIKVILLKMYLVMCIKNYLSSQKNN